MITFASHVDGYYDVADQVPHALRREAEALLQQQMSQKAACTTVTQFEARRAQVRAHFLQAIGGLPQERTPLHTQITGVLDQGSYTIEKLIYQSLPDFYVTALLYLPKGVSAPTPAVVFVHGHFDGGKSAPEYQAVCIDLVNNGFAVLAVDPPGQGERKQYYDPASGQVLIPHCTDEHTCAGLQFVVSGANIARHFIWDVMRGVDYLETRPEVDTTRLGLTGNSGGGLQSSYLMVADRRFTAAMPCTFLMTLASYHKTGQPQDSEQIVASCFVHGPDHDDYITMLAPKPVLVGVVASDFFPVEGSIEVVARAKEIYKLYNAEENVDIAITPGRHSYNAQLREAAVNWFKRHLKGETPDFKTGPIDTLPEAALWCTPKGQIFDRFPQSRTVVDLNSAWVEANIAKRTAVAADATQLRATVANVLGIDLALRRQPIYPRIVWDGEAEGYPCEKIFFFSEPDMIVTGVMIHPHGPATQTDLLLFENGTNDIPNQKARLTQLLAAGHRLFVFDVRGVGAVQTRPVNPHRPPHDTEYKLGCDAMMLGKSTLGMRVFDVLRGYDYLRTRADVDRITIVGVDSGALFAYLAAALEPGFAHITAENLLSSYRDLIQTKLYDRQRNNLRTLAWGILPHFDLPDLLPVIGAQRCTVTLCNGKGEVVKQ